MITCCATLRVGRDPSQHKTQAGTIVITVTGCLQAASLEQDGQPRERLELHADYTEPITWPNFQRLPGEETPATAET